MASSFSEEQILHDWVEAETRQIDIVASWENLCQAYESLGFCDPLTDMARMEEFKWIVKEMNKHLTRARSKLMSARDAESTRQALTGMFKPSGSVSISSRKELAYHKLRQRWVIQMLATLDMMCQDMTTGQEEQDAR